ncbi:MAG: hypothetical protein AB1791_08600 [Chloroflexota bacterium]
MMPVVAVLDNPSKIQNPKSKIATPFGPVGYDRLALAGGEVAILVAAVHVSRFTFHTPIANHQLPIPTDPRALAYAAKALGAERVIALARDTGVERPSVPDDFIEFTTGRPTTFFTAMGAGYVQQDPPFCPELRQALLAAGAEAAGPLLILDELPPAAGRDGWAARSINLITTVTQPEGALCRELELCFAVLVAPPEMVIQSFLAAVLENLPAERGCTCGETMALARRSGRLAADWRGWVGQD